MLLSLCFVLVLDLRSVARQPCCGCVGCRAGHDARLSTFVYLYFLQHCYCIHRRMFGIARYWCYSGLLPVAGSWSAACFTCLWLCADWLDLLRGPPCRSRGSCVRPQRFACGLTCLLLWLLCVFCRSCAACFVALLLLEAIGFVFFVWVFRLALLCCLGHLMGPIYEHALFCSPSM